MPPKNNTLSERDLELAGLVWQCFKSQPAIDYQKLAEVGNFKNPNSANASWNAVKKKLIAGCGATADTPTTPAKRAAAATAAADGPDGDFAPTAKKQRKQPATRRAAKSPAESKNKKQPYFYGDLIDEEVSFDNVSIKSEQPDDRAMVHPVGVQPAHDDQDDDQDDDQEEDEFDFNKPGSFKAEKVEDTDAHPHAWPAAADGGNYPGYSPHTTDASSLNEAEEMANLTHGLPSSDEVYKDYDGGH